MKENLDILLNKIQNEFKQNIDIIFSFHINGKIKNIIYSSATETLSEPLPDKIDGNQILLIPYLDSKSIKIEIKKDGNSYEILS